MQDERPTVTGAAVADHPATLAWLALRPGARPPAALEVLKEKKQSAAYRLCDTSGGGSVVAKRSPIGQHTTEKDFYTRVLPVLEIETPRYYGAVRDEHGCWLFVDDVGERWYRPDRADHRQLAGEWLAVLQRAPKEFRHGVPDLSVAHYRALLRTARTALGEASTDPALKVSDLRTLNAIVRHLDLLELAWPKIEAACAVLPESIVHGDFVPKNVRLVPRNGASALVVFDWGTAGWGPPGPDLSAFWKASGDDGLRAYSIAQGLRPGVGLDDLRRAAAAGMALRVVRALEWETWSFTPQWIEHALRHIVSYERYLRDLLAEEAWL